MSSPSRPIYTTEGPIQTHLRNIKLHPGVTWISLAEAASSEVDGMLGVRYVTPMILDPQDPEERASAFWLQNVTSMIAAGRYMLSTAAPGSQDQINSYGNYLVSTAKTLIDQVLSGKIDLGGVEEVVSGNAGAIQGATILNQDAYSQVDVFYDNHFPDGFAPGRYPRDVGTTWPR